jgi:hypothetical protein
MKKIISFSLWGDKPIYTVGAISNTDLAKSIYPDWICRFYIHKQSVPEYVISELSKRDNVEIVYMPDDIGWSGMLWRFYPATEDDVSVMLSRDCDSRLTVREKECVFDWLYGSTKKVHTIRDHPMHQSQMMGGLWGVRDGFLKWMKPYLDDLIETTKGSAQKGIDQHFLNDKVYLYSLGILDFDTNNDLIVQPHDLIPSQFLSHDDVAFGKFKTTPATADYRDEIRPILIKKQSNEPFMGKDYSLDKEELKYLKLSKADRIQREDIIKYHDLYMQNKDRYGLTGLDWI